MFETNRIVIWYRFATCQRPHVLHPWQWPVRSGRFRLIEELIKRRVPNAVVFYAVACFVLLQIADITFEPLGIPSHYVPRMITVMLGALPMVILLAWKLQVEGGFRIEVAQPINPALESLATVASVVVLAGHCSTYPPLSE